MATETIERNREFLIDHVQIFCPIMNAGQFATPVTDAAQADHRQLEAAGGAQHRIGFHVDHVGIDAVIGNARDDIPAARQSRRRDARNNVRDRNDRGLVEKWCQPSLEAERRTVHVAICDARHLIDFRVFEAARSRRTEREDEIRQRTAMRKRRERRANRGRRLDRADTCDQRIDARFQVRAILMFSRHDK